VREAPNGDTKACPHCGPDGTVERASCYACAGRGRVPNVAPATARYLHVAEKYNHPEWARQYLTRAHWEACKVATALGVPDAYYPRPEDGTLRVLEYQPGGFQPEHTDFDLFTIVCYRSHLGDLERTGAGGDWARGLEAGLPLNQHAVHSPGLHIGEIGELVGLGPATTHRVPARPYAQQSIVYFAMPSHAALLPYERTHTGEVRSRTVGEWLAERIARSRY
jgi:hypothetical protein